MNSARFFRKILTSLVLGTAALSPVLGHAEHFPEGLLGMRLGSPRTEAMKALFDFKVQVDPEQIACSTQLPEKHKYVADRICKMVAIPGGTYLGHPVSKVSWLLMEDKIILIGLEIGDADDTFGTVLMQYTARLGEPNDSRENFAYWKESPTDTSDKASLVTAIKLIGDKDRAYIVYAPENVK